MTKAILVTGGTGYIGSHTTVTLLKKGYEVIIIDDLSNSNPTVLENIAKISGKNPKFYQGSILDRTVVDRIFYENSIQGVIHFAAAKAVGESVENPLKYYEINVSGLISVLKSMLDHRVYTLIFSSSCTVYGQPETLPVTEETPDLPAFSPYGNTKQIGEKIIKDTVFSDKFLKALSLRYFNPVGAHESALIGELPNGIPNNLLPFITQTAIGKREQLSIFGNDYQTKDGTCLRDYIHVVDLAQAHVQALEFLFEQAPKYYDFFNVGTGKGTTVLEMIQAFEKNTQQKLNYVFAPRRAGDIESVFADTTKIEKILNWKAKLGLEEMVKSAWEWEKSLSDQN